MVELKPPPVQAGGLSGSTVPGWALMTITAARCWLWVAALSLAAGLIWRAGGFAPPLLGTLDGCGLALWATALFLEPAWARLQSMQSRNFSVSALGRGRAFAMALRVAGFSVPIALALVATLLAYDTSRPVARVLTLEQLDLVVSAGVFSAYIMLAAGPTIICLSLAVLAAARAWVGRWSGLLVWGAILLAVNSSVFAAGSSLPGWSLGAIAGGVKDRLNLVNSDPTQGMYISDLVVELIVLPAAFLAGSVVLLSLSTLGPAAARIVHRTRHGWVAALLALAAVALASLMSAANWAESALVTSPGDWQGLMSIGATVLIVTFVLLKWTSSARAPAAIENGQMLWSLAIVPALALYTLPNLFAGQADQLSILLFCGVTAAVCALFLVVTATVERLLPADNAARHIAYLVLLALAAFPVDAEYGSVATALIRQLNRAAVQPEYRPLALPMVAVLALVMLFGLWEVNRRRAPARRKPA